MEISPLEQLTVEGVNVPPNERFPTPKEVNPETVLLSAIVPLVVIVPPVKLEPAVILVTVPVPPAVEST